MKKKQKVQLILLIGITLLTAPTVKLEVQFLFKAENAIGETHGIQIAKCKLYH